MWYSKRPSLQTHGNKERKKTEQGRKVTSKHDTQDSHSAQNLLRDLNSMIIHINNKTHLYILIQTNCWTRWTCHWHLRTILFMFEQDDWLLQWLHTYFWYWHGDMCSFKLNSNSFEDWGSGFSKWIAKTYLVTNLDST